MIPAPWTDVTHLRYYLTSTQSPAVCYGTVPPFILQDGACLNLYQGEAPIRALGLYRASSPLPAEYGIDGARIDMKYRAARRLDPGDPYRGQERDPSLSSGPRSFRGNPPPPGNAVRFHHREPGTSIKTPGCGSSGSSCANPGRRSSRWRPPGDRRYPRFAWRYGDKRLQEILILLNYFLPNTVPSLITV